MNIYESDKLLNEYLLLHYASAAEILPPTMGEDGALFFPVRCVTECLKLDALPSRQRALDLGCAVGRSTFELGKVFESAVGIDSSARFIEAAEAIRRDGELAYHRPDEGDLVTALKARVPAGARRSQVTFEVGNAMQLRSDLGIFDAVLLSNLIDRLGEPKRCLAQLPGLIRSGGQLIITSPYTWLEEFTPRQHWLGGFVRDGKNVTTLDGLHSALDSDFECLETKDLPFVIREHSRKYQLSFAQASVWRRL